MQQQKSVLKSPHSVKTNAQKLIVFLSEYTGETVLIYYYNCGFIKTHQQNKKIDTLYKRLVFTDQLFHLPIFTY